MSKQSPPISVEFAEVSGVLLVSSSSGMSSIPSRRWCPQSLLVAKERANRRAAAASSSSGSNANSRARQAPKATIVSVVLDDGKDIGGCDSVQMRENESAVVLHELLNRRQARVELKAYNSGTGCGGAGDHQLTREGARTPNGDGMNETRPNTGRDQSGNVEGKGGMPSDSIAERERIPQAFTRVGDIPVISSPIRSQRCGILRESDNIENRNRPTILDLMSAKFSSLRTSSPLPNVLPMKVRRGKTGLWLRSRTVV